MGWYLVDMGASVSALKYHGLNWCPACIGVGCSFCARTGENPDKAARAFGSVDLSMKAADMATCKCDAQTDTQKKGDLDILQSTWDNLNTLGFDCPDKLIAATNKELLAVKGVTQEDVDMIRSEVG